MTASNPDPGPEPSPSPTATSDQNIDDQGVDERRTPDITTHGAASDEPDPLGPWPGEVAWHAVSPRLVWLRAVQLAIAVVPLTALVLLTWFVIEASAGVAVAAGVCCLVVVRAFVIVRAVRSWGYAERADDLLVRHGLMVRRLSIVPYARMQFVDVSAGPLERVFGLATVQLHTAAAASDARIPGLPPGEAARLRDRLAALGQVRAEGL